MKKTLFFLFTINVAFSGNNNYKNSDALNFFNSQQIIHVSGHYVLPLAIAYSSYGSTWKSATRIMILTNFVDVDHLLANPIFDPDRCSIGFHPLHSLPAIGLYSAMVFNQQTNELGIGLLTHIAVDLVDCINTKDRLGTLKFSKLYRDPVNNYSMGHIVFWYGMSQFTEMKVQHMQTLSLVWEIIEFYLPYKFAQESYLNKFCDILFNSLGFYMGKHAMDY